VIVIKPQGVTPDVIAFAPDGALLAASSTGLVLSVYDAFTGRLLWRTPQREHDYRTGAVHFSPDGRVVCLAWECDRIFDARTGEPATRPADQMPGSAHWPMLELDTGVAIRVASPDGRWSTGGRSLELHDAETNRTTPFFPHMGSGVGEKALIALWALAPMAFSPDGTLFVGADNSRLHVFRCEDLIALTQEGPQVRAVATLKSVRKFFQTAAFTPNGHRLLTGTNDGLARAWDTGTWQEAAAYDWKAGPVRCIVVTADGTRAAVAGTRKIVVWDLDI
jgi:WD40 repeat protein